MKVFSKRKVPTSSGAAQRINPNFTESTVKRSITAEVRAGASVRSIQRTLKLQGVTVPQRDLIQYIRTNYSDRTFNRYLTKYGQSTNNVGVSASGLFENTLKGTKVKGFIRATDIITNTKVFHTVDLLVAKNSTVVEALQKIRENGFERLSDSLNVEIQQVGFLL